MSTDTKNFKFYVKSVNDNGTFEGLAAVYRNVDLGGDIIEPGAFSRTIKAKSEIPILWQHDPHEPIGKGRISDSDAGLLISGELVLQSDVAQKAYALMKAGVLKGLSIGYDTVVSEYDKQRDVRKLKELKLWEVSLVTFPMNPQAAVSSVKGMSSEMQRCMDEMQAAAQTCDRCAMICRKCIDQCNECSRVCTECMTECQRAMKAGGMNAAGAAMRKCMDECAKCMAQCKACMDECAACMKQDQACIDACEPQVSALMGPDSDSGKSLATHHLSDSDLHSLMNLIAKEIQ